MKVLEKLNIFDNLLLVSKVNIRRQREHSQPH